MAFTLFLESVFLISDTFADQKRERVSEFRFGVIFIWEISRLLPWKVALWRFNWCTCETESSTLICSVKTNISRWVRSPTFTVEKNKTQKRDVKRRRSKAKLCRIFVWTWRSLGFRQRRTRRTSQKWHVINWCIICGEWCIVPLVNTIHHGNPVEYDFFRSYFFRQVSFVNPSSYFNNAKLCR